MNLPPSPRLRCRKLCLAFCLRQPFMFFPPRAPLYACPFPPPPQHFPDPQLQELRRARTKLLAEPSGDITAANQAAIKAGAGSVEEAK